MKKQLIASPDISGVAVSCFIHIVILSDILSISDHAVCL